MILLCGQREVSPVAGDPVDLLTISGRLLLGRELVPGLVTVAGDRIVDVHRRPDGIPDAGLTADIVAPGLIDLQVNGGHGVEIGADPAAIQHLAEWLPSTGVTAFLPTLITSPASRYPQVFNAIREARTTTGACPLGLHVEGPFLSPRRHGAHRIALIEAADDELFEVILAEPAVRLVTLASERPGAMDRIHRLRDRGIAVSLGHTDATYEQLVAGIDAGATMVTHLYNAMSPFAHRAPGVIGAALVDDRVAVGLIPDGVHSHPASVNLAVRAKGPDRIALVSDMMPAAGMPPGQYQFGEQTVSVDGVSAKLPDGTLAGSIVTMDQAIRNVVEWTDATPANAIRMASEVPARLIGLVDRGQILPGYRADLTLFDSNLTVRTTVIAGQLSYDSATSPKA
jgi:N-acetylglucosamine-6-phosphate deacetylase